MYETMANNMGEELLTNSATAHFALGVTPIVGVDYHIGRVNMGSQPMIVNTDATLTIFDGESATTIISPVTYNSKMKYNAAVGLNYHF